MYRVFFTQSFLQNEGRRVAHNHKTATLLGCPKGGRRWNTVAASSADEHGDDLDTEARHETNKERDARASEEDGFNLGDDEVTTAEHWRWCEGGSGNLHRQSATTRPTSADEGGAPLLVLAHSRTHKLYIQHTACTYSNPDED